MQPGQRPDVAKPRVSQSGGVSHNLDRCLRKKEKRVRVAHFGISPPHAALGKEEA